MKQNKQRNNTLNWEFVGSGCVFRKQECFCRKHAWILVLGGEANNATAWTFQWILPCLDCWWQLNRSRQTCYTVIPCYTYLFGNLSHLSGFVQPRIKLLTGYDTENKPSNPRSLHIAFRVLLHIKLFIYPSHDLHFPQQVKETQHMEDSHQRNHKWNIMTEPISRDLDLNWIQNFNSNHTIPKRSRMAVHV